MYEEFLATLRAGDPAECDREIRRMKAVGKFGMFYRDGETFLHTLAREGHVTACDILLNAGAEVDNSFRGKTPLHLASASGSLDVCKLLIRHGALVNSVHWEQGMLDSFERPHTPLWYAAIENHPDVCHFLLGSGASGSFMPENADKRELTTFQSMVSYGHVPIVRWFVLEAGEDLAQRTRNGRTLLQIAGKETTPERAAEMKAALRSLKSELAVIDAMSNASVDAKETRAVQTKMMTPLWGKHGD